MKKLILLTVTIASLGLYSCNKEPGEGGTSSITGKVWAVNLNGAGDTLGQYYGMDKDVYIIYGDENQTYNDKFATSLDGSYAFHNLTPGKYTIFAYSECDACLSGTEVVQKTVEITGNKQSISVENLVIIE